MIFSLIQVFFLHIIIRFDIRNEGLMSNLSLRTQFTSAAKETSPIKSN